MKGKNVQVLSVDWLEVCAYGDPTIPAPWRTVKETYGTQNFENRYTVWLNEQEFCTICTTPRSKILKYDMVLIKLIS